uniref:Uncharacterized protein n=1 Tax=Cucumis melo TaxID=3656 RepID=A0A9I9EDV8_CUCME
MRKRIAQCHPSLQENGAFPMPKSTSAKNVGNKGFFDAVNNSSGDASGKQSFPKHHKGVGKNTSGKGTIPDAVNSASGAALGIGVFPDANRNQEEKKKGEEVVAIVLFCRCSAAVRRRPPSLLSLAAVCHFSTR